MWGQDVGPVQGQVARQGRYSTGWGEDYQLIADTEVGSEKYICLGALSFKFLVSIFLFTSVCIHWLGLVATI